MTNATTAVSTTVDSAIAKPVSVRIGTSPSTHYCPQHGATPRPYGHLLSHGARTSFPLTVPVAGTFYRLLPVPTPAIPGWADRVAQWAAS